MFECIPRPHPSRVLPTRSLATLAILAANTFPCPHPSRVLDANTFGIMCSDTMLIRAFAFHFVESYMLYGCARAMMSSDDAATNASMYACCILRLYVCMLYF